MTLQRGLTGFRSELWVHSLSSLFGWKTLHCWKVNFQPHLRLRCSRSGLHLPVLASPPPPRCLSVGMELGWWCLVLGDTSNCIQMLQSWAHQIRKMCFSHCQGPSGAFLQTLDELSEVWEETICLPNGVLRVTFALLELPPICSEDLWSPVTGTSLGHIFYPNPSPPPMLTLVR